MIAGAAFLVVAIALLEDSGPRRLGAAGLVGIALGLGAARAAPGAGPSVHLTINTGLVFLGTALSGAALGVAVGQGRRQARSPTPADWAAAIVGAIGLVLMGRALFADLSRAGTLRVAAAALLLGCVAGATASIGGRLRLGTVRRRETVATPPVPRWLGVVVGATGLAGWGGTIPTVMAGGAVSAWAAWLAMPGAARKPPVPAALATVFLGAGLWLFLAIRGPEGLGLFAISWLPISPAAERLLALLLLGAAWCLSGLWPLRQPHGGVLTAPAGALLLARVALPAVPGGLAHWQPLVYPVVLLGMWHAALTRRVSSLAIGGGLLGLASLDPGGLSGAGWLLACAVALELAGGRRLVPAFRAVLALAGAWGAFGVLTAGLRTEVVYTVLGAAAVALALAGARPAGVAPALTPPASGSILPPDTVSPL